jgi:hypothetical protein
MNQPDENINSKITKDLLYENVIDTIQSEFYLTPFEVLLNFITGLYYLRIYFHDTILNIKY